MYVYYFIDRVGKCTGTLPFFAAIFIVYIYSTYILSIKYILTIQTRDKCSHMIAHIHSVEHVRVYIYIIFLSDSYRELQVILIDNDNGICNQLYRW